MNIEENHFMRFLRDNWLILLIASFNFFILFIPNLFGYYGYLRDELYIIACSKRLAFGYIDHPPFAVLLMSIIRFFLGDSILAIRLLPALANAVLIFLIGIITKRLGGKQFAQGLAGFAFSIMPFYLMMNAFYSMTGFEPLLLTCCVLVLIIIIQENKQRYWLILGLIMGIGIINKYTFVIFGVAILIGIIFTPLRKFFLDKFIWLGILLTVIIILPNIIWQIQNDFISVEFFKYRKIYYEGHTPPFLFMAEQIIMTNPMVFPISLLGIFFLLFKTEGKPYRVFGWMFLLSFVFFLLMGARPDRVATAYPILIASGSIVTEIFINKTHKNWLKKFIISLLIIGGIFSFLIFLPIFPPKVLSEYTKNRGVFIIYHQFFADRLGWESMAEDIATVYNRLPDEDKDKTVIFALNYGEAGAIELFGSKYNLPMVISANNNYRLWGYGNATGDLVISIGVGKEILNLVFEKVEESGVIHTCDYCMDYENNLPIYICRKTKIPLKEVWQIVNREILPPIYKID